MVSLPSLETLARSELLQIPLLAFFHGDEATDNAQLPPVIARNDNMTAGTTFRPGAHTKLASLERFINLRVALMQFAASHGIAKYEHISTKRNPSNLFTKALPRLALQHERQLCGLQYFDEIAAGNITVCSETCS